MVFSPFENKTTEAVLFYRAVCEESRGQPATSFDQIAV
jgi:hypothetical protein